MTRRLPLALALLLVGCPVEPPDDDDAGDDDDVSPDDDDSAPDDDDVDPGDDDVAPDDDDATPQTNTVLGVVLDIGGAPIADVVISPSSGLSPIDTGADGRFSVFDPDMGDLVVGFEAEGYAPSWQAMTLVGGDEHALLQRLTPLDLAQGFPALGGAVLDTEAGQIDLPAASFVDPGGAAVSGVVTAAVVGYSGDELSALPGDGRGMDASGALVRLDFFGGFGVALTDPAGGPVELAAGSFAELQIPADDPGGLLSIGQEVPAWWFDPGTGLWGQAGDGVIFAELDGSPTWLFSAHQVGVWAPAVAAPPEGCVEGSVVNPAGQPRGLAWVRADTDARNSWSITHADGAGSFCVPVVAGATWTLSILWALEDDLGFVVTDPIPVPPAAAACGSGSCFDIGQVPVSSESCVSGITLGLGGAPESGIEVTSSLGDSLFSGVAGAYCMAVPVLTEVTVFGPPGETDGGYLPWTVVTQPGAPDCSGGCANIAVVRPYPQVHCASGTLTLDGSPTQGTVEILDGAAPVMPVYEFTTEADGSFCTEVPSGTSVLVSSGDLDCSTVEASTIGLTGAACPAPPVPGPRRGRLHQRRLIDPSIAEPGRPRR